MSEIGNDFGTGISPIGGYSFAWEDTIISQYANSDRLLGLIENFSAYIDQTENMAAFYDKMWNIATAEGYGLDVWGRIVGIGRALQVAAGNNFGFDEAMPQVSPFGQGAFYSGAPVTSNYLLTDGAYRVLILAKALANICEGSIPAINKLLMSLFPSRGNCYVQEGVNSTTKFLGFDEAGTVNSESFNNAPFYSGQSFGRMMITYIFEFELTPVEFAILAQSGVLPTPCGVGYSVQSL